MLLLITHHSSLYSSLSLITHHFFLLVTRHLSLPLKVLIFIVVVVQHVVFDDVQFDGIESD
jgi:hypothetical protein